MMFPAPPGTYASSPSDEDGNRANNDTGSSRNSSRNSKNDDGGRRLARAPLPSPVPSPQPPLPYHHHQSQKRRRRSQRQQRQDAGDEAGRAALAPQQEPQQQQEERAARTASSPASSYVWGVLLVVAWTCAAAAAAAAACFLAIAVQHRDAVCQGAAVLRAYWQSLWHYWTGGDYATNPHFREQCQSRVHLRSLALITEMWHQPHYRSGTFGADMAKNLRNVALPGTGLPLSTLCTSPLFFKAVLLFVYPTVALAAAVLRKKDGATAGDVASSFAKHLVRPTDWFSLWRLNCRLASYHALKTKDDGYRAEDKWTFITESLQNNVPVTPIMEIPNIVCKDRNEEGGMGIHFFQNALSGGDWIIQKVMHNSEFLSTMLPKNAPLSTIRIVTGSTLSHAEPVAPAPAPPPPPTPTPTPRDDAAGASSTAAIKAFSCVFRAGRAGASTDHDAVLFDVDLKTGVLGTGTVNKEWYQLGLENASLAKLRGGSSSSTANTAAAAAAAAETFVVHPDCGAKVTGVTIPDIAALKALCIDAHRKSCPNVPLCGWDVALTTEGVVLLEVNLSCNFFQATIDYDQYFDFVDSHFKHLSQL